MVANVQMKTRAQRFKRGVWIGLLFGAPAGVLLAAEAISMRTFLVWIVIGGALLGYVIDRLFP